ncbi:MAG: hypothetical protein JWP27_944 [Flaviaesturariibacter sp.]|nr:hypothetical protein [Flaviaesturariibacter sp.]
MSKEAADKRFLKEWEEQRKGSRLGYFLLYTVIWSFILYVATLFYHLAMRTVDIGFMPPIVRVLKFVLMAFLITAAFYYKGQYRYYRTRFEQQGGQA